MAPRCVEQRALHKLFSNTVFLGLVAYLPGKHARIYFLAVLTGENRSTARLMETYSRFCAGIFCPKSINLKLYMVTPYTYASLLAENPLSLLRLQELLRERIGDVPLSALRSVVGAVVRLVERDILAQPER